MIALQGVVSIAALLFIALVLFNNYRVDLLRQELFELRDRLFDEAMAGRLSFDSRAYRATRIMINGMLRFAHRASLARFLVALGLLQRNDLQHAGRSFEQAMAASSEVDRQLCAAYIREVNAAIARHLIKSPFSFMLLVPISYTLAAVGVNFASRLVEHLSGRFKRLDQVAFAEGSI